MPPRTKKKIPIITKRLQTELQALIAYASYDSKAILRCGKSAKKATIVNKLYKVYMPSNIAGDDRMSYSEMFLEGKDKFKSLFVEKECSTSLDSCIDGGALNDKPPCILMIPEALHCITGKEIIVSDDCINASLLTRKNLSNLVDIKADTLFRHAKQVEANCKKALALCLSEDSPYRNFDGTYPSGTNWEDYLVWIRKKMYVLESKLSEEDIADGDLSVSDDAEGDDAATRQHDDDDLNDIPDDEYFKGYFAFALWGFIPPAGGEKYKSSLMEGVVDTKSKSEERDSRAAIKKGEKVEKEYRKELEVRGSDKATQDETRRFNLLINIMVKGRHEMQKQRLFKCRVTKIEFQMRYAASRIDEIKEELKELKDESDNGSVAESEMVELKDELKKTRKLKKDLFQNWKVVTESEEARRSLLDTEHDEEDHSAEVVDSFDPPSLSTSATASVMSPLTDTSESLKRKHDDVEPVNIVGISTEISEETNDNGNKTKV